jgi:drug/metabolite transporter (DMT)-like permease
MLLIPIIFLAAGFQTARNAVQRDLMGAAGTWGATLMRFLFGLPFATLWLAVIWFAAGGRALTLTPLFAMACLFGALCQMFATAALLTAMQRSSFAIGSTMQQVRIPLGALVGFGLGDVLAPAAWAGIAVATIGLLILGWPRTNGLNQRDWGAVGFGLLAGAMFACSANAFRTANITSAAGDPWLGAAVTLWCVQALQTLILTSWLFVHDRAALMAGLSAWRRSIGAGFFGFAASACWFTAFGMAPTGAVQALGVVEIPMSAWAGRRLFKERMSPRQIAGASLTALGVVAVALSLGA